MPITRSRITLPGVKPIQEAKPGYEYFYLCGAVDMEPSNRKPDSGFSPNTSV
jgi:hypothetical protein